MEAGGAGKRGEEIMGNALSLLKKPDLFNE